MAKKTKNTDQSFDDSQYGEVSAVVEVRVSSDRGETWQRRKVNMGGDLEESGLKPGEIFQWQGEKYEVIAGEDGLRVEKMKKSVSWKQPMRRNW